VFHALQLPVEALTAAFGEEAAVPGSGVTPLSASTEGTKKLLIIRVDFPDYQGQVVSDATLQQLIADTNTVYTEMSSGKASFAPFGQGSAITPTVRMPNNSSVYASHTKFSRVLNEARTAAAAAGYMHTGDSGAASCCDCGCNSADGSARSGLGLGLGCLASKAVDGSSLRYGAGTIGSLGAVPKYRTHCQASSTRPTPSTPIAAMNKKVS
jgi:hypothetical protein